MEKKTTKTEATYKIKDFIDAAGIFKETPDIVRAAFYFEDPDREITESEAKKIVSDFANKKID